MFQTSVRLGLHKRESISFILYAVLDVLVHDCTLLFEVACARPSDSIVGTY